MLSFYVLHTKPFDAPKPRLCRELTCVQISVQIADPPLPSNSAPRRGSPRHRFGKDGAWRMLCAKDLCLRDTIIILGPEAVHGEAPNAGLATFLWADSGEIP